MNRSFADPVSGAFPEAYKHVAMKNIRRVDIVWQEDEVSDYQALETAALLDGQSVPEFLKRLGSLKVKPS